MDQMSPKKSLPWAKIIIGIVVAFFVVIIAIVAIVFSTVWGVMSAPTKAADLFLDFSSHEIYDSAYAYITPDLQADVTEEDLIAFIEDYPVLADMESVSFSNKSIENNTAIFYGTITGGGETSPIYMELKLVGDDWLVDYLSFSEDDIPVDSSWDEDEW